MAVDYERALQELVGQRVQFILIGGVAGILHGSAKITFDVDVVYARNTENFRRLSEALKPFQPYLRGAPPGLPFLWDPPTIQRGLNFTLTTTFGDIDLLGEATGGGTYERLVPHSAEVTAFGVKFLCVGLERLIQLKRAAGRPKDLEAIAELQALLEERRKASP